MEEEAAAKKKAMDLSPNEVHFYWKEIVDREDAAKRHFRIQDQIEVFNADSSPNKTKTQLKSFNNTSGRMFVAPMHSTAKARMRSSEPEERRQKEKMKSFGLRGLGNIKLSNPGQSVNIGAPTRTYMDDFYAEDMHVMSTTKSKIDRMKEKIEYEKRMRQMAEKELERVKKAAK